jgi:hypothetical protein
MSFDRSKGSVMVEFNYFSTKVRTVADAKREFKLADHEIDEVFPFDRASLGIIVTPEAAARIEKQKPAGFDKVWWKR